MTVRLARWRGALPRAVPLAVAVSLLPIPVMAGETAPAQKARATTIQASIRDAVAREVAAMPARPVAVTRAAQSSGSKQSMAFFKTGPGIAALAILAVGVGYANYSTQHDRITSPAKE